MIGWRGASRYYDPKFKPAFMMEAAAVKKVREEMGLTNVIPMVPFCRTVEEGMKTQDTMAEAGLYTTYGICTARSAKGKATTPIYVMCEIPSNVLNADAFLDIFDGMSIGSNDLTQLHAGPRPRFRHRDEDRERKQSGRGTPDRGDHREVPRAEKIYRHLRPGAVRLSRLRAVPRDERHRKHFSESRHRRQDDHRDRRRREEDEKIAGYVSFYYVFPARYNDG